MMAESSLAARSALSNVALRCPVCGASLEELACDTCGFRVREEKGILHALAPARERHFAQFVSEYEHVRAQEGRGALDEQFYVELPFRPAGGAHSEQWRIRAATFQYVVKRLLPRVAARRRVLDLGAGNCWLSHRLALGGFHPFAVDLVTNAQDGLGAAMHFRKRMAADLPRFRAELGNLPFADEQFDAAIFNASLHYAESYEVAVREALRCVKPGGLVVVADTPWYARESSGRAMVAERQSRFCAQYQTASDSIQSLEYLTDARLAALEESLGVRWEVHRPWYGWRWALRPLAARLKRRREPSRFRVYVAVRAHGEY